MNHTTDVIYNESLLKAREVIVSENQESQETQRVKMRYNMNPMLTKCVRITREEIAPYIDLDAEAEIYEAYQALANSSPRKH